MVENEDKRESRSEAEGSESTGKQSALSRLPEVISYAAEKADALRSVALDAWVDEKGSILEIVSEVPFLREVFQISRVYSQLQEWRLSKNAAAFIEELRAGDREKAQHLWDKEPDEKKAEFIETVVSIIHDSVKIDQASVAGRLTKAMLSGHLSIDMASKLLLVVHSSSPVILRYFFTLMDGFGEDVCQSVSERSVQIHRGKHGEAAGISMGLMTRSGTALWVSEEAFLLNRFGRSQ